jgi:hypothetical protein
MQLEQPPDDQHADRHDRRAECPRIPGDTLRKNPEISSNGMIRRPT